MKRTETFYMPLYKCKCCGEIIAESQLEDFEIVYKKYHCHGRWCLCERCLEKGVNAPSITHFTKQKYDFIFERIDRFNLKI